MVEDARRRLGTEAAEVESAIVQLEGMRRRWGRRARGARLPHCSPGAPGVRPPFFSVTRCRIEQDESAAEQAASEAGKARGAARKLRCGSVVRVVCCLVGRAGGRTGSGGGAVLSAADESGALNQVTAPCLRGAAAPRCALRRAGVQLSPLQGVATPGPLSGSASQSHSSLRSLLGRWWGPARPMARRALFQSEAPTRRTPLALSVAAAIALAWALLATWQCARCSRGSAASSFVLPEVGAAPPRARARVLVVYVFSGSDPEYEHNMRFFLREAVKASGWLRQAGRALPRRPRPQRAALWAGGPLRAPIPLAAAGSRRRRLHNSAAAGGGADGAGGAAAAAAQRARAAPRKRVLRHWHGCAPQPTALAGPRAGTSPGARRGAGAGALAPLAPHARPPPAARRSRLGAQHPRGPRALPVPGVAQLLGAGALPPRLPPRPPALDGAAAVAAGRRGAHGGRDGELRPRLRAAAHAAHPGAGRAGRRSAAWA